MRQIEGTVLGKQPFFRDIPDDCKEAMNELYGLRVFDLIWDDGYDTFADVFYAVAHEFELWDSGEYTDVNDGAMTGKQARQAEQWMVRWQLLADRYDDEWEEEQ